MLKRYYIFLIGVCSFLIGCGVSKPQNGMELLDRSIAFHDPDGKWGSLVATIELMQETPNNPNRESSIFIDRTKDIFQHIQNYGDTAVIRSMQEEECSFHIKGQAKVSAEDMGKYRLTCDLTKRYRDYYMYLYGLPMKLKDPGTNIDAEIKETEFNGIACQSIKVTYDEKVGKDTWYFYFHPKTYAMIGYRFYKDESKNDGEYILLDEMANVKGIKMPKIRKWYYNQNNKFLGTDIIKN